MDEADTFETALCGALVAGVAREMANPRLSVPGSPDKEARDPRRGFAGDVFQHFFQGSYKVCCRLLCGLRVAEPVTADGSPTTRPTCYFKLTMDVPAVAAFIARSALPNTPSLDDVFGGFPSRTAHSCEIATSRQPFLPSPDYRPIMDLLVRAGYARRSGGRGPARVR